MCTALSVVFSNDETKSLFTPWKLGSMKWSKYLYIVTFDWYFDWIVLLKPHFNCCKSFSLSWVDNVTTGT